MSPFDPETESSDLSGKTIVVTGGNSGIGYEVVKHCAKHGGKVYIAARSQERTAAAIEKLKGDGITKVEALLVDLASMKDVKRAAEVLASKESKIDILVNNAGIMPEATSSTTTEGLPALLAINHFGPFLLTRTLLPLLKTAAAEPGADVRIVNVASSNYVKAPSISKVELVSDLDIQGEGLVAGMSRYRTSKLCNVWFTTELQKRFDEEKVNITAICLHPGSVSTEGMIASMDQFPWPVNRLLQGVLKWRLSPPEVGAYSTIFAATATRIRDTPSTYKAQYIVPPNTIEKLQGQATNGELAKQMWMLSERVTQMILAKGKYDE